ncbi:DUF4194 domain-containing protein [Pelagibius sp.]|uniref:DUF4194 domain-containing protein n=1 Tax=Pelagibius sp. TaxID=1931238 RepID=UPI003B513C08
MAKADGLTISHAKIRLLSGPLAEDEDPEIWAEILASQDHLTQWFREIGAELIVHADYRIALVRQMTEAQREQRAANTGKAVLPAVLKSRALTFFDSQVLTYLHEKLNTAASMGIYDLTLLKSEVYSAIVHMQPEAQRNKEATIIKRIDAALGKFQDYGLVEETHLNARPAIRPNLVLLVMVSRDELARFSTMVEGLLGDPEDDTDTGPDGDSLHESGSVDLTSTEFGGERRTDHDSTAS